MHEAPSRASCRGRAFSRATNTSIHRYPKVIYIVRDPRDVVLSEYYFDIKRRAIADDFPLDQFVSRFVRGELNHPYGTWGENTATWFYARGNSPRLLLVNLRGAAIGGAQDEMARIAEFHWDSRYT